ncbi:hypothetical protein COLO4_16543 [Corchorus olitorius]|uniref:Uncharacterized protein n=1 Tax=Corchorus olitorius TaxID=93759 RepID=A0A1R3JGR2_9ROSI|nr:hypothetical protein COLO4_16543 [Corchorus olitorius]
MEKQVNYEEAFVNDGSNTPHCNASASHSVGQRELDYDELEEMLNVEEMQEQQTQQTQHSQHQVNSAGFGGK